MICTKKETEVEKMKAVCQVAAKVLQQLSGDIQSGISTYELDQLGKMYIESHGATSACYQYKSGSMRFPAYTCISVNEEIVHGIGRRDKILKDGDIITLDICVMKDGFVGDNAATFPVGDIPPELHKLLQVSKTALSRGLDKAINGAYVGDISYAIQSYVDTYGYGIVREFAGHGIGRSMHESPQIPNYGKPKSGQRLKPGMTLAIEPMINLGGPEMQFAADGWTAIARDGKPSAHFEHTILVTDAKPEILTMVKI